MDSGDESGAWAALLRGDLAGAGALGPLFAPVLSSDRLVIGRLAQTLDGRIATRSGHSQWIGGRGDIRHTHRLRALCGAVVVGAATVAEDDPQLTTRLVPGPSPLRVVLDPRRRLSTLYRVFQDRLPTLLVTGAKGPARHGTAEVLVLPREAAGGGLDLPALLAALAERGCGRVFVEGGGTTVSRFLLAGLLDRLHVTVAPMILGSGRPAFDLPEVATVQEGLRFRWAAHDLAPDTLFDIALREGPAP